MSQRTWPTLLRPNPAPSARPSIDSNPPSTIRRRLRDLLWLPRRSTAATPPSCPRCARRLCQLPPALHLRLATTIPRPRRCCRCRRRRASDPTATPPAAQHPRASKKRVMPSCANTELGHWTRHWPPTPTQCSPAPRPDQDSEQDCCNNTTSSSSNSLLSAHLLTRLSTLRRSPRPLRPTRQPSVLATVSPCLHRHCPHPSPPHQRLRYSEREGTLCVES